MAAQGSISEGLFQYQKPSLSVHMPKIRYVQRKKGYGGNKGCVHLPCLRLTSWLSLRDSRRSIAPVLWTDFSITRVSLSWYWGDCQGHHLTGQGCNPLLKQILQVNLIDQLFSLLLPLPKQLQLFPNSLYWFSDNNVTTVKSWWNSR